MCQNSLRCGAPYEGPRVGEFVANFQQEKMNGTYKKSSLGCRGGVLNWNGAKKKKLTEEDGETTSKSVPKPCLFNADEVSELSMSYDELSHAFDTLVEDSNKVL